MRTVKILHLDGGGIGPRTESYINWNGPIPMVPCLHQGDINTKRKLQAWRDQMYIPLVGGITALTCVGRQNTPSRRRRFGPRTETCLNWDGLIAMVPCFIPKESYGTVFGPRKYLYQKKSYGHEETRNVFC